MGDYISLSASPLQLALGPRLKKKLRAVCDAIGQLGHADVAELVASGSLMVLDEEVKRAEGEVEEGREKKGEKGRKRKR